MLEGKVKRGISKRAANRQKLTTYVAENNYDSLKEISERTQIPVGRLIDQAVSEYLRTLEWQQEPSVPPIDHEYLKQQLRTTDAEDSIAG